MKPTDEDPPKSVSLGDHVRAVTFCLGRSRFSLLILTVGLALLLSDQGRDLLISYGEDGKTVSVAATVALWAFSIWFWCRVLLDIRYKDPPSCTRCYNQARKWIPRVLGAMAYGVVAFSAFQADQVPLGFLILSALVAVSS